MRHHLTKTAKDIENKKGGVIFTKSNGSKSVFGKLSPVPDPNVVEAMLHGTKPVFVPLPPLSFPHPNAVEVTLSGRSGYCSISKKT